MSLLQQYNSHAMVSNYREVFSIAAEGGANGLDLGLDEMNQFRVNICNLSVQFGPALLFLIPTRQILFFLKQKKTQKLNLQVSGIVSCPKLKVRNRIDENSKNCC